MSTETMEQFRNESLPAWCSLVEELAQGRSSVSWSSLAGMVRVLNKVAERAPYNTTFFPIMGTLELTHAGPGHEPGCLELGFADRVHVVRPVELQLVMPARDPRREAAYFRLETAPLAPSGVYEELTLPQEEVVELSPGRYVDFSVWDQKVLGRDEYGDEIPLPPEARRVTRSLRGAYLILAAASRLGDEIDRAENPGELSAEEWRSRIEAVVAELHSLGAY